MSSIASLQIEKSVHSKLLRDMRKEMENFSRPLRIVTQEGKSQVISNTVTLFSPMLCDILKSFSPSDDVLIIVPEFPIGSLISLYELTSVGFIKLRSTNGKTNNLDKLKVTKDIIAAGVLFGIELDIDSFQLDDAEYLSSFVSLETEDTLTFNRVKEKDCSNEPENTSEASKINIQTESNERGSLENDSNLRSGYIHVASFARWPIEIGNIISSELQYDQISDSESINLSPKHVHRDLKGEASLKRLDSYLSRGRKRNQKFDKENERFKCAYCFCERDRDGLTHHLKVIHGVKYQRGFNM